MKLFIVFVGLGIWVLFAYLVADRAKDNGYEFADWFMKALFTKRAARELDMLIEQKRVIDEANKVKNEYRMKIDEQKELEKKVLESTKIFPNHYYNGNNSVHCFELSLIDHQSHISSILHLKSYTGVIDKVKATLTFHDLMDDVWDFEEVLYEVNSDGDAGFSHTVDTKLVLGRSLNIETLKKVDIKIQKVVFKNLDVQEFEITNVELFDDTSLLKKLRSINGKDVVRDFDISDKEWICYCGHHNQLINNVCPRCSRDKNDFKELGNIDILIEKLDTCPTCMEAKELIGNYEVFMGDDLFQKLISRVDKDLYVKRMYGMSNEKERVLAYKNLILEG